MDIEEVRAALKDTVNTVRGLEVTDLCDSPNPPCAIVYPSAPFPFDIAFEQNVQMPKMIVLLLVPYVDTEDAQSKLDAYLSTEGPQSVINAISEDTTLGGVVSSAAVTELVSYGVMQMHDGGIRYLSAELAVEIYA